MQLNEARRIVEGMAPDVRVFTVPATRAQKRYGIPEHADNWAVIARLSFCCGPEVRMPYFRRYVKL